MDQRGESINGFTIEPDVQLDEIGLAIIFRCIIKGGISSRNGFEPVIKIKNDFSQWKIETQFDTGSGQIMLMREHPSFFQAEVHDGTDVFRLGDDLCMDIRFFDKFEQGGIRKIIWCMDFLQPKSFSGSPVRNVWNSSDDFLVEFPA